MAPEKKASSPLLSSAQALDDELREFEKLSENIRRAPLKTQKNLETMAGTLTSVADCEERIGARVAELVQAIASMRDRQQSQAEVIQARAVELQKRADEFKDLIEKYASLGRDAADLNARVQAIAAKGPAGDALVEGLADFDQRVVQVLDVAESLQQVATDRDFDDVARQADSLRQQLLAARNKMTLLHKSLAKS